MRKSVIILSLFVIVLSGCINEGKVYQVEAAGSEFPKDISIDLPEYITAEKYLYDFRKEWNWHQFDLKLNINEHEKEALVNLNLNHLRDEKPAQDEVIKLLGDPSRIIIDQEGGVAYTNLYYGIFQLFFGFGDKLVEIRLHKPGFKYNDLSVGSTLSEVLELYPVNETITGEPIGWRKGNILYKDIEGQKSYHYVDYPEEGLRFFFGDDKVTALYLY